MPIFSEKAYHLMVRRGDDFHIVQPCGPKITLKGDKSCTIENCTLRVIGPAWTGSTMSPKEVVAAPLNLDKIRLRFSRPDSLLPI